MRFRILFSFCLTLSLAISSMWPAVVVTQRKPSLPPGQDPLRMAQQIEHAKRMSGAFRRARKLLLDAGVPFEPGILFSPNWRKKVLPYIAQTRQMHENRSVTGTLAGVQLADTLLLPEKIVLTGDTVILARQLVFAGKHVEIRGTHDLHVFPLEPVLAVDTLQSKYSRLRGRLTNAAFRSTSAAFGRLVHPETITIDLNGEGRREWLERQKAPLQSVGRSHHSRISYALQSANGQPGATGSAGNPGSPGYFTPQAQKGGNGVCGSPDGGPGIPGYTGIQGGAGGVGGPGQDGKPGNTLTLTLESGTNYTLSAQGGEGGWGGRGGDGGPGGTGGQGGDGGNGASCPCDQRSGNGGRAGVGGQGGPGNIGGDGGPGANGGQGGIINLTKPCDYSGWYITSVNGGSEGLGGQAGGASLGGQGGQPGQGGSGGSNIECLSLAGSNGQSSAQGPTGESGFGPGAPGEKGSRGPDGSVNVTVTGNCGGGPGGGDPVLEPGGYNEYCTEWYWVWYHCDYIDDEESNLVKEYGETTKANHVVRPYMAYPPSGWNCYEVARWSAGCW